MQVFFCCLKFTFPDHIGRLGEISRYNGLFFHAAAQVRHRFFAHTVNQQVGTRFYQDGRAYFVLPVVIMRQSSQGGFDTSQDDRHVRV